MFQVTRLCLIFSVHSWQGDFPQFLKGLPSPKFKKDGCDIFYINQEKSILKFKLITHFSFFLSNGSINTDFFLSLNLFLWDFPVQSVSGLQARGGKGYFSIDFLEFSIEN